MHKTVESHRLIQGHNTYSQAHQDLFVRHMLDFKRQGIYVEIGASHPIQSSNTFVLEAELSWKGLSIEIDPALVKEFNDVRINQCVCADATTYDFREAFVKKDYPPRIDYLSLDIDPASVTYTALENLPLDAYRFTVITYEHDNYLSGPEFMSKSRLFFERYGYVRVVSNVLCCGRDFEDWYIDPTYLPFNQYKSFIQSHIECHQIFSSVGLDK